jgi:putative ABC transport system ATP-binding protein
MSPQSPSALPVRAEGLEKTFGRRRLWSDLSFDVEAGEFIGLTGPSGSGKTTLLNCIGLLERVDGGTLWFGGQRVSADDGRRRRLLYRDSLGFLFQDSGLVDDWTVAENVAIALPRRGISRADRRRRMRDAWERVGIGDLEKEKAHTLSGGERQRVGLARLLLTRASVVLVDEPTASLDDDNAQMVIAVLRELGEQGAAVLVSTHDDRLLTASDRLLRPAAGARPD